MIIIINIIALINKYQFLTLKSSEKLIIENNNYNML